MFGSRASGDSPSTSRWQSRPRALHYPPPWAAVWNRSRSFPDGDPPARSARAGPFARGGARRHRLDARAEDVRPEGEFACGGGAQRLQLVLADARAAPHRVPRSRCVAQPGERIVLSDERIVPDARLGAVATPGPVDRMRDHPRTQRVEVDKAASGDDVRVGVDLAGVMAALPDCAGPAIGRVDVADATRLHRIHHVRHCQLPRAESRTGERGSSSACRRGPARRSARRRPRGMQVGPVVRLDDEAGLAVVAPLDNVERAIGQRKI